MADSSRAADVSIKESVVMRLIGLFIFVAPKRGAEFLADVHVRTAALATRPTGDGQ